MKLLLRYFSLSLLLLVFVSCVTENEKIDPNEYVGILPTPQIELLGHEYIPLNTHGKGLSVFFANSEIKNESPVNEGIKMLNKRLQVLGHSNVNISEEQNDKSTLIVDQVSEAELLKNLKDKGTKDDISPKQLSQGYYIKVEGSQGNGQQVSIQFSDELGLYYALVSICQLIQNRESGELVIPEIELADWPELGLRLGKASATDNTSKTLNQFYRWMSVYKINLVGLQFHGDESRELGRFQDNIDQVCPEQEKIGLVETIVYYCPFRGNGYNFQLPSDKEKYVELINWVFDKGADGFEIDYNDWPDEQFGLPAEEVVTFAYNKIIEKNQMLMFCIVHRIQVPHNIEVKHLRS